VEAATCRWLVEGASQYLAVYGDDALAGLRKLAREPLKAGGKLFGIERRNTREESVVARQSLFSFRNCRRNASFSRANNSISEAYWRAAKDRAQRNDHDLDEIMSPALPVRGSSKSSKQAAKTFHASLNRRVLDASA